MTTTQCRVKLLCTINERHKRDETFSIQDAFPTRKTIYIILFLIKFTFRHFLSVSIYTHIAHIRTISYFVLLKT